MVTTAAFRHPGLSRAFRLVLLLVFLSWVFTPAAGLARNPYKYVISQEGDPGDGVLSPAAVEREPILAPEPETTLAATPTGRLFTGFRYVPLWMGPTSINGAVLLPANLLPACSFPVFGSGEGRCQDAP